MYITFCLFFSCNWNAIGPKLGFRCRRIVDLALSASHLSFAPAHGGSGPHLIYGSLGLPESTLQMASRSVQLFLQFSRWRHTNRPTNSYTTLPRYSVTVGRIYAVMRCANNTLCNIVVTDGINQSHNINKIYNVHLYHSTSFLNAPRNDANDNKASVDYTSPALCTPVTPFPATGDAAYRQHAGGGPSHGLRQHAE